MIYILGAGPGRSDLMTAEALEVLKKAKAVIGSERLISGIGKKAISCCDPKKIAAFLKERRGIDCAVLMSGDTGFFSGTKKLLAELDSEEYRIIPGISSMAYFCAKIGISCDDAFVVSAHGRECSIVSHVRTHRKTFVLLGENPCRKLEKFGFGDLRVFIGERLSYDDEKIYSGTVKELAVLKLNPLSVIMIINDSPEIPRFGIDDDEFIRGSMPMTKSEIRAQIMSRFNIDEDDICFDIGAGTGSVSVEIAMRCPFGKVYAVEKTEEGTELIRRNALKFKTDNIEIIHGTAPESMPDIAPDKAFIGGSGGKLEEIVKGLYRLNKNVKIIITAISIETVYESCRVLDEMRADYSVTQISAARSWDAGGKKLMRAQNPVFVIG